nr:OprD family outer membrane porin [Azomonas macrocytogenes]
MATGALGQLLSGEASAEFLKDSKLSLSTRNFYYNQDTRNENGLSNTPRFDEWGQAFTVDYRSGFTEGKVGFGLDLLGLYGIRLDDGGRAGKPGEDRQPGSVFPLESNGKATRGFGRLGVTAKMRFSNTLVQYGTLKPKLPVVIANDGRLLPQTYEGGQVTVNEIKDLTFIAGKLEHSSERNSSNRDSLSIEGSNNRSNSLHQESNEFYYGGFDYKPMKNLLAQYYYGELKDFYKQHFFGLIHDLALPAGSLKTDLRYFYSESDGENSSRSGRAEGYRAAGYWGTGDSHRYEVDNKLWSAMFTYSLGGHQIGAGYQKITGKSDFPHLNQGGGRVLYLITDAQMHKFHNSGENTWVAKYAYDFAAIGVPGLKASLTYLSGDDIDDSGSDKKEWERDTRLDYVFQDGMLKGLGLTWMYGVWRGNDTNPGSRDKDENRLIANYTLPIF